MPCHSIYRDTLNNPVFLNLKFHFSSFTAEYILFMPTLAYTLLSISTIDIAKSGNPPAHPSLLLPRLDYRLSSPITKESSSPIHEATVGGWQIRYIQIIGPTSI